MLTSYDGEDGITKIWNVRTGECLSEIHHEDENHGTFMISPDGQSVMVALERQMVYRYYDAFTGKPKLDIPIDSRLARVSRDGIAKLCIESIATDMVEGKSESKTGNEVEETHPDSMKKERALTLRSTSTGKILASFTAIDSRFSPYGRYLLAVQKGNQGGVWDYQSGILKHSLKGLPPTASAIQFSEGNHWIWIFADQQLIGYWDFLEERPIILSMAEDGIFFVPITSHDGRIAAIKTSKACHVYDLQAGTRLGICDLSGKSYLGPDRTFVVADGSRILIERLNEILIYDTAGSHIHSLIFKEDSLHAFEASPTSNEVAVMTGSGTIHIYLRSRPESWWGVAYLPTFWTTVVLAILLLGRVFLAKEG
ncbi:MAG: WD40 repeat domain-containing protein [Planctomycetes bacterium]|nr:WD40 repeat domain-containing protein [Planctomycetota bacterium]